MRGKRQFIPKESFGLSIGVGILVPLLLLLLAFDVPTELLVYSVIVWPVVAGFAAGVTFGTGSPGGVGYNILAGLTAYFVFFGALLLALIFVGPAPPVGPAVYLSVVFFPVSFIVQIALSIVGAGLGSAFAEALER